MAAGDISKALLATCRFRLGEPAADRWQDNEIYGWLNEAQMVVANEEGLDAAMYPLTEICNGVVTTAVFSYGLPADFLRERYVTLGGIQCRRLETLNLQATLSNIYFTPAKTQPLYSIVGGQIVFMTGGVDPDSLVYTIHYVRKPMRVRAITSLVAAGTILTVPTHGLTTVDNASDPIAIEGMTGSAGTPNGNWTMATAPTADTLTINSGTAAGTGGRMIHLFKGQIAGDEDPLLGPVFYGFLMDWAVARCREQALERGEADRQMAHFRQRMEVLKSRYGTGRPSDGIAGDPGRRQQG